MQVFLKLFCRKLADRSGGVERHEEAEASSNSLESEEELENAVSGKTFFYLKFCYF
jgi:hypothetical protein